MKPPPGVYFRNDPRLLVWRPQGTLNETAVNRIIAFIAEEEAKSDTKRLRLIDTSELTAIELNFRYVFHVALHRRLTRLGRKTIKSAFLIKNPAFLHYIKLHALLTDHSPLQVKIFGDLADAAKWLDVPAEPLLAE